ncbi:hypothetical protein B0H15DRAFT_166822 [Mycena belliarum]|uniref:Uncharacterized protein n=1 Tax=Mycena belliarum TaxID=1033014 RepID=A0AAD6XHJ1_9AGAR|nr:hypothetical protein B0H15DRAFT_166822 [Mycena belliae]
MRMARTVLALRCSRPALCPRLHHVQLPCAARAGRPAHPRLDVYTRLGHRCCVTPHKPAIYYRRYTVPPALASRHLPEQSIQRSTLLETPSSCPSALTQIPENRPPMRFGVAPAPHNDIPPRSSCAPSWHLPSRPRPDIVRLPAAAAPSLRPLKQTRARMFADSLYFPDAQDTRALCSAIDGGAQRSNTASRPASADPASKLRRAPGSRAPTVRPTPTLASGPSRAANDEETRGVAVSELAHVALPVERGAISRSVADIFPSLH